MRVPLRNFWFVRPLPSDIFSKTSRTQDSHHSKGIVEQTLQTRRDDERRMIIAALRRLRHQQELKGMNGPSFRPGVFPLFTDEWHESLLHYLQETEPSDDQPMFVAIPTLQEGVPWPRSQADSNRNPMQNAKSLLEYHYRFNGGLTNASGMDGFISPTPVNVSELWCLVVDKSKPLDFFN
ncbi:hypothetical protein F4861DRAFT_89200 [Xylaria intraflava]|nr:hypothetical protein F4861DRAFT_89200 [Xylaria intraflava]